MAVMDIVDTKMLSACNIAIVLHRMAHEPYGQNFDRISISVNGMVTRHNSKSVSGQQENASRVESNKISLLNCALTRYGQVEDEEVPGGAHYWFTHHSNDHHNVSYGTKHNQHAIHCD